MAKVRMCVRMPQDIKDRVLTAYKIRDEIRNFEGLAYDSVNKFVVRLIMLGIANLKR